MQNKLREAFKKGFKEGIEKRGISIKEARIMLALTYDYAYGDNAYVVKEAMEKQAIFGPIGAAISTSGQMLAKSVPLALMLGALVGAGGTLLKRKGQRKQFMYEKGVESKLDKLLKKMRQMEGLETVED